MGLKIVCLSSSKLLLDWLRVVISCLDYCSFSYCCTVVLSYRISVLIVHCTIVLLVYRYIIILYMANVLWTYLDFMLRSIPHRMLLYVESVPSSTNSVLVVQYASSRTHHGDFKAFMSRKTRSWKQKPITCIIVTPVQEFLAYLHVVACPILDH